MLIKRFSLVWLLKKCWLLFAIMAIGFAILISLTKMLNPFLKDYQPNIEAWLSEQLHMPVKVGAVQVAWRGLSPIITFERVALSRLSSQRVIHVETLAVGINLFQSLFYRTLKTDSMTVSGMSLTLFKDSQGQYQIKEFQSQDKLMTMDSVLVWLFAQQRVALKDFHIIIEDNGPHLLEIQHLNLKLTNRGYSHRLEGSIIFNRNQQSQLHIIAKGEGELTHFDQFKTKVYIAGNNLSLLLFSHFFPKDQFQIESGLLNFSLTGTFKGTEKAHLESHFKLSQFKLLAAKTKQRLSLQQILGNVNSTYEANKGWGIDIDPLKINFENHAWPQSSLHLSVKSLLKDKKIALKAGYLHLDDLQWFYQNVLTFNQSALSSLSPHGDVTNVQLMWEMGEKMPAIPIVKSACFEAAPTQKLMLPALSKVTIPLSSATLCPVRPLEKLIQLKLLAFDFNNLSVAAWKKIPLLQNITGRVAANHNSGELTLVSHDSVIALPLVFRQALSFSSLKTKVHWINDEEAIKIRMPFLEAATPVSTTTAQMLLTIPHDQTSPVIELLGRSQFQQFGKKELYNYLPFGIIPKPVVSWLDRAIHDGGPIDAAVVLNGPLKKFPFDDYSGTFMVDAKVASANLDYYKDWPMLNNIHGELRFMGREMQATLTQGEIHHNQIKKMTAHIPKMSTYAPVMLNLEGALIGDLQEGLSFINKSPLKKTLGKRLQGFKASGPMDLNLQLAIPISQGVKNVTQTPVKMPVKVTGDVALNRGKLLYPAAKIDAAQITGMLHFTEEGLYAKEINGMLFGHPVTVNINSEKNEEQEVMTIIAGQGQADISALQQSYDIPLDKLLTGIVPYQFQLNLADKSTTLLHLQSELIGVESPLPPPFAKVAAKPLPVNVHLTFLKNGLTDVAFDLDKKINGILQLKREKTLTINKGRIHFGEAAVTLPNQSGLWIDGRIDSVNLDDYRKLSTQTKNPTMQSFLQIYGNVIGNINLHFNTLTLMDRLFKEVTLDISHDKNTFYAKINSDKVKGTVRLPISAAHKPILIALDYVKLTKNDKSASAEKSPPISAKNWPALHFSTKQFSYDNKAWGALSFQVLPYTKGLQIDNLTIKNASFMLEAKGQWQEINHQQETQVAGKFVSRDVKATLQQLGIPANLESKQAALNFNFNWLDTPFAVNLNKASGKINLMVKDGTIVGLSKETSMMLSLGRLVTLLSLETLPKRLSLDFSDLTQSGYSFNSMQGDFSLQSGNLTTQNAHLEGTVAKVSMQGQISLAKQDYNLELIVTPNVTSSLPLVATLAGGPLAGVVTWVLNEAISPEVKKLTRSIYKITGPWDKPQIMPVKAPISKG